MRLTVSVSKLIEFAFYVLIALVGIQFLDQPQLFVFALLPLCVLQLLKGRKVILPMEWLVLILTFTTYFFIMRKNLNVIYTYHYAAYWLAPITGYLCGYVFVQKATGDVTKKIHWMISVIGGSMVLFAVACTVFKYINPAVYDAQVASANLFQSMRDRYVLNIWTDQLFHPTNLNSLNVFPILLWFYVVKYVKDPKKRTIFWLFFGAAILVAIVTGTRTNFVLSLVGLIICAVFSKHELKTTVSRNSIVLLLIMTVVLALGSNWIIGMFENSVLAERTESLDNNRVQSIVEVLAHLDEYPMGNMPLSNAHNLWADVARVAGIIPMFFLILYTVMVIRTLHKLGKSKNVSNETKVLFRVLTYGLLISFSIEPVIAGRPFNFMFFCLLNGMCAALLKYRGQSLQDVSVQKR